MKTLAIPNGVKKITLLNRFVDISVEKLRPFVSGELSILSDGSCCTDVQQRYR
jgi:hypothetical protein